MCSIKVFIFLYVKVVISRKGYFTHCTKILHTNSETESKDDCPFRQEAVHPLLKAEVGSIIRQVESIILHETLAQAFAENT